MKIHPSTEPPLVVFRLIVLAVVWALPLNASAIVITGITLTGPSSLHIGETGEFTFTVVGTLEGTNNPFLWSVIEDDGLGDDELVHETPKSIVGFRGEPFTETFHFSLTAMASLFGPQLVGEDGYSQESHNEVFILIENDFPPYTNLAQSNVLAITIPEPAVIALLGLGFAGLVVTKRRRAR